MSRPELQNPPELFYDAKESKKYTSSSRIIQIQTEIANRAIELLALPEGQASFILDVGCGSGLSGRALEEAGHAWIGCDVSSDMLDIANEHETDTGDVMQHDMGLGLPFRQAVFDGAISISALQWLCYSDASNQVAKKRLSRFFSSLYNCLKRTSRAVLQFYPQNPDQAVLIASCASGVGFTGGLVVDYPNSSKAKKYYLCLGFEHGYKAPTALGTEGAGGVSAAGRDSRKRKGKGKRAPPKDRNWVLAKKERMREQGKKVRQDNKYTARKRRDRM